MENNKCQKLDYFCYVCGHIVPKIDKTDRKKLFTKELKTAYYHYFDEADLSGANFTPTQCAKVVYNTLIMWFHGKGVKLSFIMPVIWVEDLTGHNESRCYACINSRRGLNRKQLKSKVYIAAFTATLPVKRAADTDTLKPPSLDTVSLQAETVFTNSAYKPKRTLTAYMIRLNSAREQIKKEIPGIKVTGVDKRAGELWRAMKDKSEWEAKAVQAKEENYEGAVKEFDTAASGSPKKRSKPVKKLASKSKKADSDDEED